MWEVLPVFKKRYKLKTIIIAEAGVNHNGSMELAKKLVDAAVAANVDYVKFQTFKADKLVSKTAQMADYQVENTGKKTSQLEMLKNLELTFDNFSELKKYCDSKNIRFLSTGFDDESIDFLITLKMDFFKVPSGEITNLPYLERIAKTKTPVIISSGMANLEEVTDAFKLFKSCGYENKDIILLHCNTEYPTPLSDVNLRVLELFRDTFGVEVGYSDHTAGTFIPIVAASCGARIIEKHFTLDKNLPGPDHKASLDPDELKQMVQDIRNVELVLGKKEKMPTESEKKNLVPARKSIVANCRINKGEMLNLENLTTRRPGSGISPMKIYDVIGTEASRDFEEGELIQ